MIKVLFVCMGNICRSPMAEGVFRKLVEDVGLSDKFEIDSAAMGPWHVGQTAHRGTLAVLAKHGIPYQGRSRQITLEDLKCYDYILLADDETESSFKMLGRGASGQVDRMLGDAYRAGQLKTQDVPDPYYNGKFDAVYDLLVIGCAAFLAKVRSEHQL